MALIYGVTTKALNQAVKRNLARFPADFVFRITPQERDELVTKCDRLRNLKHSVHLPFAFTELGVAMPENRYSKLRLNGMVGKERECERE